MIRLNLSIALHYEIADHTSDFIFNIHAAQTAQQTLATERLEITPPLDAVIYPDANTATRFMRLKAAPATLDLRYAATVDIDHYLESSARLEEVSISQLPPEVLQYLYPSRYCQSNRLHRFATREFCYGRRLRRRSGDGAHRFSRVCRGVSERPLVLV